MLKTLKLTFTKVKQGKFVILKCNRGMHEKYGKNVIGY